MIRKFIYFKVGDEVLDRRNLSRKGVVQAYLVDGKLSKDFVIVRWQDGEEELTVPDYLAKPQEVEESVEEIKRTKASRLEEEFEEEIIDDEDIWLGVAVKLNSIFSENEVRNFIRYGTLILRKDKFTGELKDLVLKLSDGRRIIFAIKHPVRKHLDVGEIEKLINSKNKEVNKEEFRSEVLPGEVKIAKVWDTYQFDFGDGNPILVEKEEFEKVVSEYNLPKEEIYLSLEKKGYWKGELDLFKGLEE